MSEESDRFLTLVDDALAYAAIERLQARPIKLVMLGLAIGLSIGAEQPAWASAALEEMSGEERVVALAQRVAAARAYVDAAEEPPAPATRRKRA
jgi:hypothetical protein